ncbi:MAG: hypothetical protein JWP16_1389 [Alphaproteobacteria bacterium]|nr:hypothetical protein [Alphaproteobacteria bacterium]
MLKRRSFLSLAAASPAALSVPARAQERAGSNAALPDWRTIRTRTAPKAEILYKTPHGKPNGFALTSRPEEIWITDQAVGSWVSLVRIKDGSVIREFQTDTTGPSGAVADEDDRVLWISSTHNSLIVKVDAMTGKTLAKYDTPGAGRKYFKRGDPKGRESRLPIAYPGLARPSGGLDDPPRLPGLGGGQFPANTQEWLTGRTGAEGILLKGDTLIYSCTACRSIFAVDKNSWDVQSVWPTPGNRPHGMSWDDADKTSFWNCDANLNAFYRYDLATGVIQEKVQLPDDPFTVCHGTKRVGDYMYFCDDTGWMCRVKWA